MTSYDQRDHDMIWDWVELPGGETAVDDTPPRAREFACKAGPYATVAPMPIASPKAERAGLFLGLGTAMLLVLGSFAWWTWPVAGPTCAAMAPYAQRDASRWMLAHEQPAAAVTRHA